MINENISTVCILENAYIDNKKKFIVNSITKNFKEPEMLSNPNLQVPDMKYKTELCRTWIEQNYCPYMEKCRFAHGKHDLQDKIILGKNYKQKDCKSFHSKGYCPYGPRCLFRHEERKFCDLNRPFYKYILELNFPNFYFMNLNSYNSQKLSEEDISSENHIGNFLKVNESNAFSDSNNNYLCVKSGKKYLEKINDKNLLQEYSDNLQKRKNSESENSQDYSFCNNYKSKKNFIYRPRLSVFERFRSQANSISFESTDVDIDLNNPEENANGIGNFSNEKKIKANSDLNCDLIISRPNSREFGSNFHFPITANSNNNANKISDGACNFSYFNKPADKTFDNEKENFNPNNKSLNCQNIFPFLNNNNLKNSTKNNNYNNNLLNSFSTNLKKNAHLLNGNIHNINCNNNTNKKNKFSVTDSNLFDNNNSKPNHNINVMYNPTIQTITDKNKYNFDNSFIAYNSYNVQGKNIFTNESNHFYEANNSNNENMNPNMRKSNLKNLSKTLSANHMSFSPKSKINNINSKTKTNKNNYIKHNNPISQKVSQNFCTNNNKKFGNTENQNNFDFKGRNFSGEINHAEKAENIYTTSVLSTEHTNFNESHIILNSFFNRIENLNYFPKENLNSDEMVKNVKISYGNSQSDYLDFEEGGKKIFSSNAFDVLQKEY